MSCICSILDVTVHCEEVFCMERFTDGRSG
jgi:hypothetical protein